MTAQVKEKHGADFYSMIGRKGGTTKERQGSGFYSEIGRSRRTDAVTAE